MIEADADSFSVLFAVIQEFPEKDACAFMVCMEIARVDTDFVCHPHRCLGDFGRKVDIGDDGDGDAVAVKEGADAAKRLNILKGRGSYPDETGAGSCKTAALCDCRIDIGSGCVAHGLDNDGMLAADKDVSYFYCKCFHWFSTISLAIFLSWLLV